MNRQHVMGRWAARVSAGIVFLAASAHAADWDVGTVHAGVPDVYPAAPTLVGGPAGSMHLSYVLLGAPSNGLYHAELPFGGSWLVGQAHPDSGGSLATLLANTVDSSDTPHIVSYEYGKLRYSSRSNATWQTESIPIGLDQNVGPGRAGFNTAEGIRFVSWDYNAGRLRMNWRVGTNWTSVLNTVMPSFPDSAGRISGLTDQPDAGTEISVVYHDGMIPGSLRIATWDNEMDQGAWTSDRLVATNVDSFAPFSATLGTAFSVRYVYVAFGRQGSVFRDLFVSRRPLSAFPNTWTEVALTNTFGLDSRKLTIRSGNSHVAVGYIAYNSVQLVLAEIADGYEAIGGEEAVAVPVSGRADGYDIAIHNGNLWVAVSSDTLRTMSVARMQLPIGQIFTGGLLRPTTIAYSFVTGLSFEFEGEVGRTYQIEYIDDLKSQMWLPLTNFTYTAPIQIRDTVAKLQSIRFYRAVSP